MKKPSGQISRRQLLAGMSGLSAMLIMKDPFRDFVMSLAQSFIHNAKATSVEPRSFFQVIFSGGIGVHTINPLWHAPTMTDFVHSPHYITSFQANGSGRNVNPYYRAFQHTYPHNGQVGWLPHTWNIQMPTVGGGQVPMKSLLNNAFMARYNVNEAAHEFAILKATRPGSLYKSYGELIAGSSSTPLPSVTTNERPSVLMEPFITANDTSAAFRTRRQQIETALHTAMNILGDFTESRVPGADILRSNSTRARTMIAQAVTDLAYDDGEWGTNVTKYRNLALQCKTTPMEGLTDYPVMSDDFSALQRAFYLSMDIGPGKDLRTIANHFEISGLAEAFATCEYAFKKEITSYQTFFAGNERTTYPETLAPFDLNYDRHWEGSVINVIRMGLNYRTVLSFVNELRRVFSGHTNSQGLNLWQECAVEVGSEFGRHLRDGYNSDHGDGSMKMLFSGALPQGPYVVGNINIGAAPNFPTARGFPSPTLGSDAVREVLNNEYFSSTLSKILNIPKETRQNSLLDINGSSVSLRCEPPRENAGTGGS